MLLGPISALRGGWTLDLVHWVGEGKKGVNAGKHTQHTLRRKS